MVIEVEEIRPPKQTIFDPRDLSLQLGRKGKCSWVGSKCHVVETAEPGAVNFITDMIYQVANGHDSKIHDEIALGNEHFGFKPEKLFVDSSYLSGELIKQYRDREQELMGYLQGYAGREEKFRSEAFEIDLEKQIAICPATWEVSILKMVWGNFFFFLVSSSTTSRNSKMGSAISCVLFILFFHIFWATHRSRTDDPLFTKQLLYQLS